MPSELFHLASVGQAKANYTRGGGRGPEEGIFPNAKRLAVLLECNKNISKHLPFCLEKLLFGSFQKGMLGGDVLCLWQLSHLFFGGGSQETHQQKHTYHPQTIRISPSEGRSFSFRSSSCCGGYRSATSGLGNHGGERASSVEGCETRRRTFLQGPED